MVAWKGLRNALPKELMDEVQRWGCMKQTGVSLKYMMEFGSRPTDRNMLISAQFLHKELAIRIARRAIELESLPYGLSEKPAVLKVSSLFRLEFCKSLFVRTGKAKVMLFLRHVTSAIVYLHL